LERIDGGGSVVEHRAITLRSTATNLFSKLAETPGQLIEGAL
jgi:hypothetical protein